MLNNYIIYPYKHKIYQIHNQVCKIYMYISLLEPPIRHTHQLILTTVSIDDKVPTSNSPAEAIQSNIQICSLLFIMQYMYLHAFTIQTAVHSKEQHQQKSATSDCTCREYSEQKQVVAIYQAYGLWYKMTSKNIYSTITDQIRRAEMGGVRTFN